MIALHHLNAKVHTPRAKDSARWNEGHVLERNHKRCRLIHTASASSSSNGTSSVPSNGVVKAGQGKDAVKDEVDWINTAFPAYMASKTSPVCSEFEDALARAESFGYSDESPEQRRLNTVWAAIRREAAKAATEEPMLSSFLYASIMAHDTLERALAFVLANRLANTTMLPTQLLDLFFQVITTDPATKTGALADIEAFRERDPACGSYSQALLYYKGFHAIQTHRIAHALWNRGQRVMALALQSRMSEVLAVDIHPAAKIGKGILLDHGTGVVIGETAVIGNNVSLLQNVTLGGTGKEVGDRHPKLEDNVLVGANATILGNIVIGRGAQVAAGSLVLKRVPSNTIVAGTPAKEVGNVRDNPAANMQQQIVITNKAKYLQSDPFNEEEEEEQEATKSQSAPAPAPASKSTTSTTAAAATSQSQEESSSTDPTPSIAALSVDMQKLEVTVKPPPDPVQVSAPVLRASQKLGKTNASTPVEADAAKVSQEHVQATRDDREAARLWKDSAAEPEYFI